VDGLPKVLGKAKFAADLAFPNMLHAKVLRSPHPHARILGIDTSKALALPGVAAVLTAKDVPGRNRYGILVKDQPVLAEEKVRFAGEAVAIVAAASERLAEEALSLIEVRYEELPVVSSPLEAMREDAPRVHEDGNILHWRKIRKGDVEEGFARAAVIVEDTFKTQLVEHAYLEPEAGVAVPETGRLTIYAVSQGVHYIRSEIAAILGWPLGRVRVVQAVTGGGFGGKIDLSVHPYIALLAAKTGRPVKLVYTREESMLASTKRHPFIMTYKIGATGEGKLIAAEVKIIGDTGAYASYGPAVLTRSAYCSLGPYAIPHVKVDAYAVYTNNPIAGAMRGFGAPQMAIAHESIIDLLAEKLGMSPVELRLKNAFTEGSETPAGQVLAAGVGIKETILQAAARAGLK
jgi:CO/xanthine dehydrogenase Mo-binding subunit